MATRSQEKCLVPGPAGNIEVAVAQGHSDGALAGLGFAAVVCHPHPLHGGTMDNKVVTTLARVYQSLGVTVARFNFRGVGASGGEHDQGRGEVDDLKVVMAWLRDRVGADKLLLAGFSFGTGVVSNACLAEKSVAHVVFVAPPVGRYNFAPVEGYPCPVCVVMGDQDELVDAGEVYRWAEALSPPASVIALAQATHFFHGHLIELRDRLGALLADQLA